MIRAILFSMSMLIAGNCFASGTQTYSDAVSAGNFLYVSGQFPIDPTTGQMENGEIGDLTNLTLDYIEHILHEKGFKMSQVVKTEVYLTDIRCYAAMDAAYASRFTSKNPPARDVIAVPELQNNAQIEISCIAYKN